MSINSFIDYIKTLFRNEYEEHLDSIPVDNFKELFDEYKLSDYLKYSVFDKEKEIFINKDGTFGFLLELKSALHTGDDTYTIINEALNKLPDDTFLQLHYFGSKDIDNLLENFRNEHRKREKMGGKDAELIKRSMDEMVNFLKRKVDEPLTKTMQTKLKRIKIFISVVSIKNNEQTKEAILNFKNDLYDIFSTNRLYPVICTPDDLVKFVYEILNPHKQINEIPEYNDNIALSKQVVSQSGIFHINNDYVRTGNKSKGKYWINLTPVSYSENFNIFEFNSKLGDYLTDSLNVNQFKDSFLITVTYKKKPKTSIDKIKKSHGMIVTQNWGERFRKFVNVRKESLDILDRIDEKKEVVYEVNMDVLIAGDTYKQSKANAQTIKTFWSKMILDFSTKIQLDETLGIHHLAFLNALPMGMFDEYFSQLGGKYISLFPKSASSLAPLENNTIIQGFNLGLVTRKGELAFIDLFNSNTNFNAYIVATSGAGKSVLLNMLAFNSYARGDKVFVLDYDNSFTGLCEAVDGQYLELNPEVEVISFNPFTDIKDKKVLEDEIAYLSSFIYMLGSSKLEIRALEDEKLIKTELQNIIYKLYDEKNNSLEVTDIRDYILANYNDKRFIDFAKQMGAYCKEGIYGGWFAGECTFDITKDLLAVEFKGVENHPDLRDPLVMLLMYHFSKIMYSDDPNKPKIQFILDEAHRFIGKSARMDDFIEQAYRRARKFGASMILATQGFGDISSSGGNLTNAGRVIIENSSWKIFLKQQPASISSLLQSKLFGFDYFEERMLRSTHTLKGEYSEMFVITPYENKNILRLIMPKFFYYLTTTDKEDKRKIAQLMEQHNKTKIEIITGGYLD